MRRLIVADIHSNFDALSAVLAEAQGRFDEIVCCGDVAGYGANPNQVVDWARCHCATIVRGNHDRACAATDSLADFNERAGAAVFWTRRQLTEENRAWLANLPLGPLYYDDYELAHGSPLDEDEYLVVSYDVAPLGAVLMRPVCFVGHTHVQGGWEWTPGGLRQLPAPGAGESERVFQLSAGRLCLFNPGSVGQPRDHDPRAAFALWDTDLRTMTLSRVAYDVGAAQARILEAGLHPWLAERLALGR